MMRDPDTKTNMFTGHKVDKSRNVIPEEASAEEVVLHQEEIYVVAEEANEAAARWVQEEEVK